MKIRAVLCDIYRTLLEVGPPPADAELRWAAGCAAAVPEAAAPGLAAFAAATTAVIEREHASARSGGIAYPEVYWPDVACAAWPALARLDRAALEGFLFEHAQLQRTVRLMPGADGVLRALAAGSICLGLVSNSQPYTLRELDGALAAAGLGRSLFAPDLCFFSFEHGFSKPDPHVFRWLAARLAGRGLAPGEALVVGDREDNDMVPARAAGFQAWHLSSAVSGGGGGDWGALGRWLGAG